MFGNTTLVTYATRKGATGDIAYEIANVLSETGDQVSVRRMQFVHNLIPYDSVVVGSAIYNGAPLPEAVDFIKRNEYALSRLPVAYFIASNSLAQPTVELVEEASRFLDPLYTAAPDVHALDVGLFAGATKPASWNIIQKLAALLEGNPHEDIHNQTNIRQWAENLRPKIKVTA